MESKKNKFKAWCSDKWEDIVWWWKWMTSFLGPGLYILPIEAVWSLWGLICMVFGLPWWPDDGWGYSIEGLIACGFFVVLHAIFLI